MSSRAKTLESLYSRGKVGKDGLRRAVEDGTITAAEYEEITGEALSDFVPEPTDEISDAEALAIITGGAV